MNHLARNPKQDAAAMIAGLPDDASIEEIFYVLEHVRAGIAELDAGEGIPREVEAVLAKGLDG